MIGMREKVVVSAGMAAIKRIQAIATNQEAQIQTHRFNSKTGQHQDLVLGRSIAVHERTRENGGVRDKGGGHALGDEQVVQGVDTADRNLSFGLKDAVGGTAKKRGLVGHEAAAVIETAFILESKAGQVAGIHAVIHDVAAGDRGGVFQVTEAKGFSLVSGIHEDAGSKGRSREVRQMTVLTLVKAGTGKVGLGDHATLSTDSAHESTAKRKGEGKDAGRKLHGCKDGVGSCA